MIYHFTLLLIFLINIGEIASDETCFNTEAVRAKEKEINEKCRKNLPEEKEKCIDTYAMCLSEEIFLTEPGKYDRFISLIQDFIGDKIKEEFMKDVEACKENNKEIQESDKTGNFANCVHAALLKNCPEAAESCEKFSEDVEKLFTNVCK